MAQVSPAVASGDAEASGDADAAGSAQAGIGDMRTQTLRGDGARKEKEKASLRSLRTERVIWSPPCVHKACPYLCSAGGA